MKMGIQISCQACGFSSRVNPAYQGKRVACPNCHEPIRVPTVDLDEVFPGEVPVINPPASPPPTQPSSANHSRFAAGAFGGAAAVLLLGLVFYLGTQFSAPQPAAPEPVTDQPVHPSADPAEPPEPQLAAASESPQPVKGEIRSRKVESQPPATTAVAPVEPASSGETVAKTPPPAVMPQVEPPRVIPASESEQPSRDVIKFAALPLPEPVTSMAMTEDRQSLVFTHQGANQVTFYEIATGKSAVASTPSPRSVLCRQGMVYVANYGEGTISVFSGAPDWTLTNAVEVIKPNIVHMSAAQSRAFDGRLIVTCHGDGNQASYQDSHIYEVDTTADTCELIARSAMASVSYDGKLIITQGSFNLSPSGGISAFDYEEFVAGGAKPVFQGGVMQTPYVYQPFAGSYWFGDTLILGGVPMSQIGGDLGPMVVPDLDRNVFYSLNRDRVIAHRLTTGVPKIGWKRALYPGEFHDDFSRVSHVLYRRRGYLLDHSIAVTTGDELAFYLLTASGGAILHARTASFEASPTPSTGGPSETAGAAPAAVAGSPVMSGADEASLVFESFPTMLAFGRSLKFPIKRPPGMTVELMSEIPGMMIANGRELHWQPTINQLGVHQLKFRVEQGGEVTFVRPVIEVIPSKLAHTVGGDVSRLAKFATLSLVADAYSLEPARDGKSLLLLQGDSLKRLGGDGMNVVEEQTLPKRYQQLAERDDVYLGTTHSPKPTLDVIDRKSLEVTNSIDLTTANVRVMEITDLAIHPVTRTSYLAIKSDVDLPRYNVLVVDESQSRVVAPPVLGKWVEVAPDGQTLYTGYSDIYKKGSRFHINPGWRLIETPDYGNVDMLLAWDLSDSLSLKGVVPNAGGNGYGIRLSADGRRLAYLSHVGTPMFSKNLIGFDAHDLGAQGVTYETKDRAVTTELAFHPFLPLVAVPGGKSAVIFHRETGQVLENILLMTAAGLGETKAERVLFAPDGEHLVFVCEGGDSGRYIRNAPLDWHHKDIRERLEIPQPAAPAKPKSAGTPI